VKERWQQWSARYNAMAPRERVLIFVALLVGIVFVFDALALEPLAARKKRLTTQLAEARQNIRTTEGLIRVQEVPADPDAVKRTYLDALRKQLAGIDQSIQGLQKGLVPPERMAKLLEEMLVRGRGLQLVSLRTLPVQRFETPGAAPAPPRPGEKGAKPAPPEPERSIYQHSYEISLQGSYLDLHDYLARLEGLPWQMFWGRISFEAQQYPRLRVTLRVHTLSLSKAWLVV
jgi:MSHA biogenesis protein MshJ